MPSVVVVEAVAAAAAVAASHLGSDFARNTWYVH
jgi:hypothetical protein